MVVGLELVIADMLIVLCIVYIVILYAWCVICLFDVTFLFWLVCLWWECLRLPLIVVCFGVIVLVSEVFGFGL